MVEIKTNCMAGPCDSSVFVCVRVRVYEKERERGRIDLDGQ